MSTISCLKPLATTAAIPPLGEAVQTAVIDLSGNINPNSDIRIVVDDNGLGQGTIDETWKRIMKRQPTSIFGLRPHSTSCPTSANICRPMHNRWYLIFPITPAASGQSRRYRRKCANRRQSDPASRKPCLNARVASRLRTDCKRTLRNIHNFSARDKDLPADHSKCDSPNNDPFNHTWLIAGLRESFPRFKLEIYERWGRMVWNGDKNSEDWAGQTNVDFLIGGDTCPPALIFIRLICMMLPIRNRSTAGST